MNYSRYKTAGAVMNHRPGRFGFGHLREMAVSIDRIHHRRPRGASGLAILSDVRLSMLPWFGHRYRCNGPHRAGRPAQSPGGAVG